MWPILCRYCIHGLRRDSSGGLHYYMGMWSYTNEKTMFTGRNLNKTLSHTFWMLTLCRNSSAARSAFSSVWYCWFFPNGNVLVLVCTPSYHCTMNLHRVWLKEIPVGKFRACCIVMLHVSLTVHTPYVFAVVTKEVRVRLAYILIKLYIYRYTYLLYITYIYIYHYSAELATGVLHQVYRYSL